MKKLVYLLICLSLLVSPVAAPAFETDQFNLPPEPLADIGAEVHDYVKENIEQALAKINREIKARQNCLAAEAAKNCESAAQNRRRLTYLQSEPAVARAVFKRLGAGFPPFTASGSWMDEHQFAAQPARYKTGLKRSIYATFPSNYLTISATVNLYGEQFGTDKIAHIFQQGYTYLRIYERARAKNLPEAAAVKRANDWGRRSERTFYGNLVSGVYSNADLAANFAGFKFYRNLTQPIRIGETLKPEILILKDGGWQFNESENSTDNLLKPFITAHLNEALNPSIYTKVFGLRSSVRGRVVRYACADWKTAYPNRSKTVYERIFQSLQTWHGEDYGFTGKSNFVTVADACFDD